jgi:hypothetical protein
MKSSPEVVLFAQLQRERCGRMVADEEQREGREKREGRTGPSGCRDAVEGVDEDFSRRAEEETLRSGSRGGKGRRGEVRSSNLASFSTAIMDNGRALSSSLSGSEKERKRERKERTIPSCFSLPSNVLNTLDRHSQLHLARRRRRKLKLLPPVSFALPRSLPKPDPDPPLPLLVLVSEVPSPATLHQLVPLRAQADKDDVGGVGTVGLTAGGGKGREEEEKVAVELEGEEEERDCEPEERPVGEMELEGFDSKLCTRWIGQLQREEGGKEENTPCSCHRPFPPPAAASRLLLSTPTYMSLQHLRREQRLLIEMLLPDIHDLNLPPPLVLSDLRQLLLRRFLTRPLPRNGEV